MMHRIIFQNAQITAGSQNSSHFSQAIEHSRQAIQTLCTPDDVKRIVFVRQPGSVALLHVYFCRSSILYRLLSFTQPRL